MTLFFPDLNVWLALSDSKHIHSRAAWSWLRALPAERRLVFSRYTQIGLLRLLCTAAVMGEHVLTLGEAWILYDRWLEDPRVEFYPEPRNLDLQFRHLARAFADWPAAKALGNSFILAFAAELKATLVTCDRALHEHARRHGHAVLIPS